MADRRQQRADDSPQRRKGESPARRLFDSPHRRAVDSMYRQATSSSSGRSGSQSGSGSPPRRSQQQQQQQQAAGSPQPRASPQGIPHSPSGGSLSNWAGFKCIDGTPRAYRYVEQCDIIDKVSRNSASAHERQDFRDGCQVDGPFLQLALSTVRRYETQAREQPGGSPVGAREREKAKQRARCLQVALDGATGEEKRVIRLGVPPFSPPLSL